MNHKYDIDWLAGWIMCQRLGIMQGSKIIGKQSLKLVPIIGWCWIFTESIFLRRVWDSDRETLVNDLRQVLDDYPENSFFNVSSSEQFSSRTFFDLVFTFLRRNAIHREETANQYEVRARERPSRAQTSPFASNERLHLAAARRRGSK